MVTVQMELPQLMPEVRIALREVVRIQFVILEMMHITVLPMVMLFQVRFVSIKKFLNN